MTPERWQQVKAVFNEVVDRPPEERAGALERCCAGDAELRREVESLLAFHHRADTFIEEPAAGRTLAATPPVDGRRVGPYVLLREIGRGGMGAVYLAERDDEQFRRQVAIKLVKRGMDTDFILERFRGERQILAGLDHPNIARLLDGGTTDDGLPYFVMEYVEGERIDAYRAARGLGTEAALELFRDVCAAVQYAHQNLVVHRDIKPGNILVTPEGVVKLLDFGLAKLVTGGRPDATATGHRMMTPEYASPEQVMGGPITTATDVYSLGVLLYELLTGRRPYRVATDAPAEIVRVVCEQEPERPSVAVSRLGGEASHHAETISPAHAERLKRRLEGDLDNIVLMAMRKEPAQRYPSAAQLADDIRRHLEGLPVVARRPTLGYRASKFVRRNKLGVAAAGLTAGSLVAGIAATLRQSRVASRERERAERRFEDVRALANSLLFEVHDTIAALPGATPARALIVRRALEYLDGLAAEADDPELRRELARAYIRIGSIQGNTYEANVGETDGALRSLRRALEIFGAQYAEAPDDEAVLEGLADSHEGLGDLLYTVLDLPRAREHYLRAGALRERLHRVNPDDPERARRLAVTLARLGDLTGARLHSQLGDTATSTRYLERALEIREALCARYPGSLAYRSDLLNSVLGMAGVGWGRGDFSKAAAGYRRALEIAASMVAADPVNGEYRRELALAHYMNAILRHEWPGHDEEAVEHMREALALTRELSEADPSNTRAEREVAVVHNQYGKVLAKTGRTAEALENIARARAIFERHHESDPGNPEHLRDASISRKFEGDAHAAAGAYERAIAAYSEALRMTERLRASHPSDTRIEGDLGLRLLDRGTARLRMGDADGALRDLAASAGVRERIARRDPASLDARRDVAVVYARLAGAIAAKAEGDAGVVAEARGYYERSAELWRELDRAGYEPGLYGEDRASALGSDEPRRHKGEEG